MRNFIVTTIRQCLNENDTNDGKFSKLVRDLMNSIERRYYVDLFISYNKFAHTIILSKIVVDKKKQK